jgi:histidine triad (HIT) family protein
MCIFCRIINHEIPSYMIYEDEMVMAILDISQATYGHTLVMPKAHYANAWEVPAKEWQHLLLVAQQLSKTLCEKLQADGCNILTNVNERAGQSVFHCHIHLLPRYQTDDLMIKFISHEQDLAELKDRLT